MNHQFPFTNKHKPTTLIVYDLAGRVAQRLENITQENIKLSRGFLATGAYIIHLKRNDVIIGKGKLMIH